MLTDLSNVLCSLELYVLSPWTSGFVPFKNQALAGKNIDISPTKNEFKVGKYRSMISLISLEYFAITC